MEIYHVRLNTGEDIVTEIKWAPVKLGHETHVIFINPMKIVAMPSGKAGFVQLSLMQWVFSKISSEQEFNVYSRDILTMSKPNANLVVYYKDTVEYFASKNTNTYVDTKEEDTDEYLDELKKEIIAIEESDRVIDEGESTDELEKIFQDLMKAVSSNNKGTLH